MKTVSALKPDHLLLTLAALCFAGGASLGMYMGVTHDFQYAPVHAHANLVGWTSLALFGIVYKLYPELQTRKLARAQVACAAFSAPLFPIALYFAIFQEWPWLLSIVAPLFLVSVFLFAALMLRLMFGNITAHEATRRRLPA